MSKTYTAQELRQRADEEERHWHDHLTAAMLRQAADLTEREERIRSEIKKIDTMAVAPLDGHPMHQHTNTEKVATVLEFFPKVKEILGGAKSLEREKKYEYTVKYEDGAISHLHYDCVKPLKHGRCENHRLVRREVGEWEDVQNEKL